MKKYISTIALSLSAAALFISGCGKPADTSGDAGFKYPEASDEAMKLVFSEFADGNGGIIWKAMPVSYQNDVNTIVRLAGTKIDAEVYDKVFALVGRIGTVVDKQQGFILNTSLLPAQDSAELEKMQKGIPLVAQVIALIANSDIATSAGLQAFEGQKFFDTTVSELAKLSAELEHLQGSDELSLQEIRDATITVVEQTETTATLTMTAGDDEETSDFVKVEDRWVPADMANDWTSSVAEAISELEAYNPEEMAAQKPQIMTAVAMLDGVLTQLESAETQEQFDQAIQGAMMPLMGIGMLFQGMGGAGGGVPAP
ncbi:MAG: hypothetical protein ACON4O_01970 [Lentimonas sp.]